SSGTPNGAPYVKRWGYKFSMLLAIHSITYLVNFKPIKTHWASQYDSAIYFFHRFLKGHNHVSIL
ncbi:MAG: hypothetical protein PHT07_20890, partial [Paludibacter sp.]|nr:hypothetical protein [Paludibacter sp.]